MEDSYVLQLLKPKFKDFHLCFCGFAECEPLHSYGPAARPNYILHYVMKGKGIYQVGETKYQLKEGQAFLIEPESLTFYQADKKDLNIFYLDAKSDGDGKISYRSEICQRSWTEQSSAYVRM